MQRSRFGEERIIATTFCKWLSEFGFRLLGYLLAAQPQEPAADLSRGRVAGAPLRWGQSGIGQAGRRGSWLMVRTGAGCSI